MRLCIRQRAGRIRHVALSLMLVQNAGFVLVMRFSRKQQSSAQPAEFYNVSVVIVLQEVLKLVLCMFMIGLEQRSVTAALSGLYATRRDLARIAVPAACFTLQNNVLYVALSNLYPLTFQISYQLKTLLTAALSVVMLGKSLSGPQWGSQLLLAIGIVLTQVLMATQPQPASTRVLTSSAARLQPCSVDCRRPSPNVSRASENKAANPPTVLDRAGRPRSWLAPFHPTTKLAAPRSLPSTLTLPASAS